MAAACLLVSCADFDDEMEPEDIGEKVSLELGFVVADDDTQIPYSDSDKTRAPSGVVDNTVVDVWILQFNGTDDNSVLVGRPQYFSSATTGTKATFVASASKHRIVAIANTANPDPSWFAEPHKTTFAQIYNAVKHLNSEAETYFGNRIMMTGWQDVVVNTASSLAIPLKRSYAKLEFSFNNQSANVTINKAVLYNVPLSVDLFAAYQDHSGGIYPAPDEVYGSFPLDNLTDIGPGELKKFIWYMPTNEKGVTANGASQYKNLQAPSTAVCIKLYGEDSSDGAPVIYTIYPGANMTNDFNIRANHRYNITVNITNPGDPAMDSRVDAYKIHDLKDRVANSYILNRPLEDGLERVYRIYPKQVNTYFGAGGYKESGVAAINANGQAQSWRVEVVWMPSEKMVTRDETDGNITLVEKPNAKGEDDYFEIRVPKTASQGNFLVGLYRDVNENGKRDSNSEPYRWSWHFWVTDYNPDLEVPIVNTGSTLTSQYTYDVYGGRVFRLDGTEWRNGIYKNTVMMDRNIGALSPVTAGDGTDVVRTESNLLYQWGRKDPIPFVKVLYNENGRLTSEIPTHKGGADSDFALDDAFAYPVSYIYSSGNSHKDWTKEPDSGLYLWKDSRIPGTEDELKRSTAKSLYDPCPYGWQLPSPLAWEDMEMGRTVFNEGRGLGFSTSKTRYGMSYWPGTADAAVDGEILFQVTGYLSGNSSYISYNSGGYHTSVPVDESYAYLLSVSSSKMALTGDRLDYVANYRSTAFGARCVKL